MDLKKVVKDFNNIKILVIGDLMIDHYLYGKAERVSAEAPVPVIDIDNEEYRLGGAANVVYNLKNLGAKPYFLSISGNDKLASKIRNILERKGISPENIIEDDERRTTLKTRVIAQNQQVIRIDVEDKFFVNSDIENQILDAYKKILPKVDAVILEDYNKGLLTKRLISEIITLANKSNKIITVDPKFINFYDYKNVTVFKPNIKELEAGLGRAINSDTDLHQACQNLISKMNMQYLVVTQGENGLLIYQKNNESIHIPTFAKQVYDVSGAGDTVISALTLAFATGLSIKDSAEIANHAAGAVCAKVGIAPVEPDDIISSYKNYYE